MRRSKRSPFTWAVCLALPILLALPAAAADQGSLNRHKRAGRSPAVEIQQPASNLMIVEFVEAPLALYDGSLPSYEATSPAARGERKLDSRSEASQAYLGYLDQRHNRYVFRMERALGRPLEVVFRYRAAANGMAVKMSTSSR